jgi:protein TonB
MVLRSSGSAALDETTCRLVLKRFRFAPARDANGQPTPGEIDYDQEWSITGYLGE